MLFELEQYSISVAKERQIENAAGCLNYLSIYQNFFRQI